ncbi:D-alanyl-D-alanine carboxypeptidase/D-alanyl-D-alanine-endopeptidase [Candidatus Dependentiae bacterium]|nr:D-alanyl-D-alanine carboxypeptidase/D-alanyl-D-alanine-endopeptidase [Candidatus Dependentiae bacterium]
MRRLYEIIISGKLYIYFFLCFNLIIVSCCTTKKNIGTKVFFQEDSKQKIERILTSDRLNQTNCGIYAVSLKTGKIIFDYNSDKLFIPASTLKLVTSVSALKILKPEYRFKTEFLTDEFIDKKTISNIYLKGYGNPEFKYSDLEKIVISLSKKISKIQGNIIIDNTYFDKVHYGKGWMWDDLALPFSAAVSALNIEGNCIEVSVAANDSDIIDISIFPENGYIKKICDIKDGINNIKINRLEKEYNEIFEFTGTFPLNETKVMYCSVIKPEYFFASNFKHLLQKHNIEFSGDIIEKKIPDQAVLLENHFSESLTLIIHNFLKYSDNLAGECLLKTIGAESNQTQGSNYNGILTVKNFISSIGMDSDSYRIEDGSGLSRYSLVSPKFMVKILDYAYRDYTIYSELSAGLPVSGIDGSLVNRLKTEKSERRIRAKTGYMSGIRCLSGYVFTTSNDIVAVSIMMNGIVGLTKPLADIQDEILNVIIEN